MEATAEANTQNKKKKYNEKQISDGDVAVSLLIAVAPA